MIQVNTPLLNGNEKKYLNECIDSGWISSEGPFVDKFEKLFAKRVNRTHGIAVCNGSAALDCAVQALGLGKGDEVIMPTFTIISCAAALVRFGAIPVLVDSFSDTWNMDVSAIESKITPRTKAIMVVHIYGLPVDMNPVLDLARKYGLYIIEDAAEMHGQYYYDEPCGSFGDISIFSFYPNKHITTGEGGMVVTDNDHLAGRCKSIRNLCFQPQKRFVHEELGFNYRMTNLQAALGLAQLEQLDLFVKRKREIGARYSENLKLLKGFQLPLAETEYAHNIYWVFGLVSETTEQAAAVQTFLAKEKIGTRPFFWCMHEQPVFQKMGFFKYENYPIAEKMARNGFYIPSGLGISNDEIDIVSEKIIEFAK